MTLGCPLQDRLTADSELPFDPPLAPDFTSGDDIEIIPDPVEITLAPSTAAFDGVAISTVSPTSGRAHLVYVSENLADLLGSRPDRLLGNSPGVLLSENTPDAQLDAVAEVVENGQQARVILDLTHESGADVRVEATFLSLPSMARDWPYYLSLFRAANPWPRPEVLIAEQSELLESLVNGEELADVLVAAAERIEDQLLGASCWVGLTDPTGRLEPTVVGDQRSDLVEAAFDFLTESGFTSTPSCLRADDMPLELGMELRSYGIHALWITPIVGADRRRHGVLCVAHNDRPEPHPSERTMLDQAAQVMAASAERSIAEASLAHQTMHDPLTQLPNRALIVDRLEQAVARLGRDNTRLAVLLVDLDRFKTLNDTRGSEAGDDVLIEISRRLRRSVRLGDTVGRIGGDQFLVVCVAMNGETDASSMAERIVDSVAEPVVIGDDESVVTSASVGVVLIDTPGGTPAKIISNAESALARAIENGRGNYALYEEELQQRVVVRHEVEQALRVAMAEQQLVLHYQPLVEIESGRMMGAEALIRWERPGHGLLAPGAFIEIAEDSGLIVPIGAWVIDETCRQLALWPVGPDGERPVISVNLSAKQLAEESLPTTVLAALARHGVDPTSLGFEVTESMRVEDIETAISTLKTLADLGCKLAIDDFGIGYATLDYLRRFSMADTLKIDRSFVSGLGLSREDTAIVSASIALARSLGLSVVAEGVETVDQYQGLDELDCDFAQGYLLSKPVPLDEAHQLWIDRSLIQRDADASRWREPDR